MPLPYDYAPRLAAIARARRRRNLLFTLCVMCLPALSFHSAAGLEEASPVVSVTRVASLP